MDNIYTTLAKLQDVTNRTPIMESDTAGNIENLKKESTKAVSEDDSIFADTALSMDNLAKLKEVEETAGTIKAELKDAMMSRLAELAGVPLSEIEEAAGESETAESAASRIASEVVLDDEDIAEAKDTHCSDKCCGSDVKAEDCNCPPDCKHCNCNAVSESSAEDERAHMQALAKASEPERGEERKKVSLKKAPWEESVEEAVGDSAEAIWELCDELDCAAHPVFSELVRYLDGDTLQDFVADFRRHNDMNEAVTEGGMKKTVTGMQEHLHDFAQEIQKKMHSYDAVVDELNDLFDEVVEMGDPIVTNAFKVLRTLEPEDFGEGEGGGPNRASSVAQDVMDIIDGSDDSDYDHLPKIGEGSEGTNENAFNQAAAAAARAGKKDFEFGGKTHKTTMSKDTAHKLDDDVQVDEEEKVEETTTAGAVATDASGNGKSLYKHASVYEGNDIAQNAMRLMEGMNINVSMNDQSGPSLTVTATDEDAAKTWFIATASRTRFTWYAARSCC